MAVRYRSFPEQEQKVNKVTRTLAIYGALVVCLFGLKYAYDKHQQEIGALTVLLEHSEKSADEYREASRVNAERYAKAVKTFTRLKTRTDTLRDSLVITDTLKVKEYVAAADSTIKACSLVVLTCEDVQKSLRGQIAAQDTTIGILKKQIPGKLTTAKNIAIGVLIGFAAGNLATQAARR